MHSKHCPQSGSMPDPEQKKQHSAARWLRWSPLVGLAALVWFVARVLPKPSRADYPCQRAAFPVASGFVLWLLAPVAGRFAWKRLHTRFRLSHFQLACVALVFALAGLAWMTVGAPPQESLAYTPADGPNHPMGTARGLFPGRVTWIRNIAATPWNGSSGHWWDDDSGVRQDVVDDMLSRSLQALTGTSSDAEAWDQLFRHHNRTHGRGDVSYAGNEKIAFKINVNNAYEGYGDVDNQIDASPQATLAMLRQLINNAGVPQEQITVYEAVRVVPNRIYNKLHNEFPGVVVVDSKGTGSNGRQAPSFQSNVLTYSNSNPGVGRSIPRCVTEATYLINQALCKTHPTTGITGTAKNHYGSVTTRDHSLWANSSKHSMGIYHPFVDMIGSNALGGKTMLFMSDALYGTRDVNDVVGSYSKWNRLFGGQYLASFFLSQDPIAIDSVLFDFLNAEFPNGRGGSPSPLTNSDNYLHEAAQAANPPSGTLYKPNGARLSSLGVHEHWNNYTDRQYTRNLGTGNGIELFRVSTGGPTPTPTPTTPTPTPTPTPPPDMGGTWEAESLAPVASGASTSMQSDTNATGGTWLGLMADGTGDYVQLTIPNVVAGPYAVSLRYKAHPNRGILQASIDGVNLGSTLDQYAATAGMTSRMFGTVMLTAGSHTLRLTCTGRNAASAAYTLSADTVTAVPYFTPTPTPPPTVTPTPTPPPTVTPTPTPTPGGDGGTWEAQALAPAASGASTAMQSDAAATGGTWLGLMADGTGDYVQFTLPSLSGGTYSVSLRYKAHPNRGILQASVDGVNLGSTLDQYSATPGMTTRAFGSVSLAAGVHTIRLTCTGRNASSGAYTLSADTITAQ